MTEQDGTPGYGRPQQLPDEPWVVQQQPPPWQLAPEVLAAPSTGLPLGLTPADGTAALRTVARVFLPVLVVLTILVAVLAQVALPHGHGGSLADWLRTAVVLTALAMGGRVSVEGSATVEGATAQMTLGLRLIPLTITLVLLGLVARAAVRAERQQPSSGRANLVARGLVLGLTAGLGLAAAAVIGRTSELYGVDLTAAYGAWSGGVAVGAGVPSTLLGTVLLVSLVAVLARAWARPRVPAADRPRSAEAAAAVRILRTFAVGLLVAASVFLLVVLLYQAAVGDDLDGNRLQELAALLVLAPNAVLALSLGALGVPLASGASGSGQGRVWAGVLGDSVGSSADRSLTLFDYWPALLALLVPLALLVATAVRRSLRPPVLPFPGPAVRPAAGIGFVAGLAVALLLRISTVASGSGGVPVAGGISGSATAGAGPSLLWAPLLTATWAVLAVWVVRFGPTLALSLPRWLTRTVAGRGIRPEWAAALAGTAPAPAGRRSPALRGVLIAAAGLALLAIAGLGVVVVVNATVRTPEAAARGYLAAVADANPDAVLDHLRTPPASRGALLDADALASKDFTPISHVTVGDADVSGDRATVHVSYSVGGRRVDDTIDLVAGGRRYGVLRTWEVAETLPEVELVEQFPLGAEFAGRAMPGGRYPALPGQYTFRPAEHPMLTAAPAPVLVTTDHVDGSPQFVPEFKPGVLENADRAVRAAVERCARSTELPLQGCPFLTDSWYLPDLSDVTIRITRQPTFSYVLDGSSGSLLIQTETEGELTLTGTETVPSISGEPEQRRPFQEDFPFGFGVGGSVTGTPPNLVVTFDD